MKSLTGFGVQEKLYEEYMICQDCLMRTGTCTCMCLMKSILQKTCTCSCLLMLLVNLLDFHWIGLPMTWKTCSFGAEK